MNSEQQQAASHTEGPLVVFAGAGSGKTKIITTRIANLIDSGVAPWEILAVTFTNKAAQEMRERVSKLNFSANRCHISTFHSACARWLREFAQELGFTSDFTIYDDSDSNSALKKVIKEIVVAQELGPMVLEMKRFIHMVKTQGLFPRDVERMADVLGSKVPDGAAKIYKRYQEYLASCNAMDFGDLIVNMLLLTRTNTTVRAALQRRYRYVLVDEFQDTNKAQLELVNMLCEKHRNLFVVGDDDQSIYSWRGAAPEHILNFEKIYPEARRVILSRNYRSCSNIVAAASAMIAHNLNRAKKELYSEIQEGDPITYRIEADGEMEAWFVAETIKNELLTFDYSEFAIFYRTNAQSRLLEEALRRENIPYRIFGAVKFYDRLEIKDLLAYFRLIHNPDDDVSVKRIINVPARGVGKKAVEMVELEAQRRGLSLIKTMRVLAAENTPKLGAKLQVVLTVFDTVCEQLRKKPLGECVNTLLEIIDYKNYLRKKFPDEFLDKNENIHELSNALADYEERNPTSTLADWLQMITLVRTEEDEDGIEGVALMTLHTAKGLEFRRVFIVGVEEGLLPHKNNNEDPTLLEEERRLFYVGMTRAREKLALVSARERMVFNQYQMNEPSQFLKEIPKKFLQFDTPVSAQVFAQESSRERGYSYDYEDLDHDSSGDVVSEGDRVRHPTYGNGTVEAIENNFGTIKAVVRFSEFGLRKVSLQQLELPRNSL